MRSKPRWPEDPSTGLALRRSAVPESSHQGGVRAACAPLWVCQTALRLLRPKRQQRGAQSGQMPGFPTVAHEGAARRLIALLMVGVQLYCAGCATVPPPSAFDNPETSLDVIGTPAIHDARASFRSLFCAALARTHDSAYREPCEQYLWRFPDEARVDQNSSVPHELNSNLRIFIVGGAFADCYPPASTPFADSLEGLRTAGISADYIAVSGRSSSEFNSKIIAAAVLSVPTEDRRPILIIGYSKGATDILETLTRYPQAARRVTAVVSVAGAIAGSPLATRYLSAYTHLLAGVTFGSCGPGNGEVLSSLTRSTRLRWLAQNRPPAPIRYYSVATFATGGLVARVLKHPQRLLSKVDARNDGQLLTQDQFIPGSQFLGVVNADHWAVAVRMEDRFPFLAHRAAGKHPFPQQVLLDSILQYVQTDLQLPSAAAR